MTFPTMANSYDIRGNVTRRDAREHSNLQNMKGRFYRSVCLKRSEHESLTQHSARDTQHCMMGGLSLDGP